MTKIPYEVEGTLHVVARLVQRIREVRSLGFQVRQEYLGPHVGSWCEISGRKIIFLDSSQTAADQLAALNEAIAGYSPARGETVTLSAGCDTC